MLPAATRPVIDGMALASFGGLAERLAARRAVALIHHPTPLAPPASAGEQERAALDRQRLRGIESRLLPQMPLVIATSAPSAERLATQFGIAPERIVTLIPGTNDVPRSVGSGGPGCHILSVGALVPRKGHDVLLRAVARLFDLDWHLTIAGSADRAPDHAQTLAALAQELGIADRVRFVTNVDDTALAALWAGADMFALASEWEGYGMAVAEALRHGLPIAAMAGGGVGALVPPEVGVICAPGDHEGLSKAMRRPIFDVGLRHAMADAAWAAGRDLPDWQTQAAIFAAAAA
jgi:glycosyltransferase involved in cell wall biosynthesis